MKKIFLMPKIEGGTLADFEILLTFTFVFTQQISIWAESSRKPFFGIQFIFTFVFTNQIAVSGTVIGFDDWGGTVNWKTFGDGVSKSFVDSLKKHGVEADFVVQVGAFYPHVHRLYLVR